MQTAYVLVTPYTIRKSRTGAVLARLLARVSCELVAARMFAPDRGLAERYAAMIQPGETAELEKYRGQIRDYILKNLAPDADGRRHRTLMLVFKGEDAIQEIAGIVGHLQSSSYTGETIRDTFGDTIFDPDGAIRYFEPCVLLADGPDRVAAELRLWSEFARHQPAMLTNICSYPNPERVQQTLVILKPDSWRKGSSRPGAILDMFSRTGLRIIGCKLCRISVSQAMEFYGPVKDVLCQKLAPGIGARAREILQHQLGVALPAEAEKALTAAVGVPYACDQFEKIVQFMTGHRPSAQPTAEWQNPGTASCLAVVYEGEDAVAKIRNVLGPTDPSKAPSGTVRREFGLDVMVNTAHASDSPESFRREAGILRLTESEFPAVVAATLAECGP
ncbi:MAG: nucleoside-diphosphate kinase [Lentisphaeria bacterium]|jgi:nucleoside diphosphate kinase